MAKLLNQGAYGCVYYPGFTCKGKTEKSKRYVTKIEIHDKTSRNELDISKKVRTIKNYNRFFSPVIKHCISRFKQVDKYRDQLKDCEPINVDENRYNDFIIIYINYIKGKELEKYVLNIESPVIATATILNSYTYLIDSIKQLQDHDIIHYDLHTGNILFDLEKKRPIIIDFGLSIDTTAIFKPEGKIDYGQLKRSIMHYSPRHYTYPPELHFITYLLTDIDNTSTTEEIRSILKQQITKESIATFIEDIMEANKIHRRYLYYRSKTDSKTKTDSKIKKDDSNNKYQTELEEFYKPFINKTRQQAIDTLVEQIKYLDIYTLTIDMCVIIIKILDKILIQDETQDEIPNKTQDQRYNNTYTSTLFLILEFLIYNLRIDPVKRLTHQQLQNLYRIIFIEKTRSSKDVLQKIKSTKKIDVESLVDKFQEMENYYITPELVKLANPKIQQLIP